MATAKQSSLITRDTISGATRVERALIDGKFAAGVILGLRAQNTPARRAALAIARAAQAYARELVGYKRAPAQILTTGAAQSKLGKNSLFSLGLMLTPERGIMAESARAILNTLGLAGAWNLCPMASRGCAAACLSRSGQSGMPAQQRAQIVRTAFLLARPYDAGVIIGAEIRAALRAHGQVNLRLNVTSDIRWELFAPEMMSALAAAGVHMYDYTAWSPAQRRASDDYSLTYSAKEPAHTSDTYLAGILAAGGKVAVPFTTPRGAALPATFLGFPVIDGDKSDERRNDPAGVVVGLRAKGYEWKRDNSAGFIRATV